jgi:hypothetical protein
VLDEAVAPSHDVGFERRKHGGAVALKNQRLGLVQTIHSRLSKTAAEAATNEPLNLGCSRRPHVKESSDTRMCVIRLDPETFERCCRYQHPATTTQPTCVAT